MARHTAVLVRAAASTTLSVGAVYEPATLMRRVSIYDTEFGSEDTPADSPFIWELTRTTTVGTIGSSVTPSPKDLADAAATTLAGQAHTVDPTLGAVLKSIPLNMRATMRWVTIPDDGFIIPATANNGIAFRTPVAPASKVRASVEFLEY
jgi:hypothetical protein